MNKPTIFQTGDIRVEFESANSAKIIRQDNGQVVELSLSEWNFLIAVAPIAKWPTVSPMKIQEIIDSLSDSIPQCRPE